MQITQNHLAECLNYCPETGIFTWKKRPQSHFKNRQGFLAFNSRFPLTEAGAKANTGYGKEYLYIKIDGARHMAHRLAWLYVHGSFPAGEIDHIDGDSTNNALHNLRDVPHRTNGKNQKKKSNNKSGVTGVHFCTRAGKWIAQIRANDKVLHLGRYTTIFEAACARKAAEIRHGHHSNHGH